MKKPFIIIGVAALLATVTKADTNSTPAIPTPPSPVAALPVQFDANGLSFTNVSLQLSSGYEYQGNAAGTSAGFVAAQDDLRSFKNFDIGVGASIVFANTQSALDKIDADFDLIKNLDSFQLVAKVIPIGRQFTGTVGYYSGIGGDLNYNLTHGLGILGTKSGFTYVSVGYRFEKNWSTIKDNSYEHLLRLSVGYAF